jgi:hypothetical protein
MIQTAADVLNHKLSKLIHHHVWFFVSFSQNEKKLVSLLFSSQLDGWTAKNNFWCKISAATTIDQSNGVVELFRAAKQLSKRRSKV